MKTTSIRLLLCMSATLTACGAPPPEPGVEYAGPGRALYDRNCAICHGSDGEAERIGRGAVDLNDPDWQRRTSVEQIMRVVQEGRGHVPGWKGRLSDEEIRAVAEYVRSLK
jgi:mono/diheme cytochrome c family protein